MRVRLRVGGWISRVGARVWVRVRVSFFVRVRVRVRFRFRFRVRFRVRVRVSALELLEDEVCECLLSHL